jgi:hypothetical protein
VLATSRIARVLLGLSMSGAVALGTAGTATAAHGHEGDHHRRGDRVERLRNHCVRELDKHRDRALLRFAARLDEHASLTDEHAAALQQKLDDLNAAVDEAVAAARAAITKRELRAPCDPRPLRRQYHLVRFQIRAVGAVDEIDAGLLERQHALDNVAAALTEAGVVDADLLVADVQATLDIIEVDGLADTILALDPTMDPEELAGALGDIRARLGLAFSDMAAVADAIDDLTELVNGHGEGDAT